MVLNYVVTQTSMRCLNVCYVCFTMQAVLQISAGVLYPAPISTSSERYCRVWMSSVKCLCCRERAKETACILHVLFLKLGQCTLTKKKKQQQQNTIYAHGSGEEYALTTQQALPKSAILTCSLSALRGSRGFTNKLTAPVNGRIVQGDKEEERRGRMIKSSWKWQQY